MKKFFIVLIPFIIIITVLFFITRDNTLIVRLKPIPVNGLEEIKKSVRMEDRFSSIIENIPDAPLFRVKDKALLRIEPGKEWKAGVFFTFSVKSDKNTRIRTLIRLKREGAGILLKKVSGSSYYHSFLKEINFRKNDIIEIEFHGAGYAAVNIPVFYKIIEQKKRNYVFVIAPDTLRNDRTGKKLNGIFLTPNIDKFMKDSVVFTKHFSQSNWTLSSFLSLFTSKYEFNHRATKEAGLPGDQELIISTLANKFFTYNLNSGLWMQGKYGFATGFDFFNTYSNPKDNLSSQKLFRKSREFLINSNIPSLFMFLHTYQIHSPYNPPREYRKKLIPDSGYKHLDTYFYKKQFMKNISESKKNAMENLYNVEINAFDYYFGKFIEFLKMRGIYNQSMIIFLSDHGEEFYEHKGWSHGHSMFNEVIKVPLFIKFPGSEFKGKIIKKNCGLIDVFPTVCDYFDLDPGKGIDGESLLPLTRGGSLKKEMIISSTSRTKLVKDIPPKFSLIKGKYKLIYNYPYSKKNLDFFKDWGMPPEQKEVEIFELKENEERSVKGRLFKKLFSEFKPVIDSVRRIIEINSKIKSGKAVRITEEEKKKLESLGYFQK